MAHVGKYTEATHQITISKNTEQKHCSLASGALKQTKWRPLVSTRPYCLLSVMLSQSLTVSFLHFVQVEEPNCDPYSAAYTDAVFQVLDNT